jgi:TetR/AcrR family transcriptional regulator, repressor for lfrA
VQPGAPETGPRARTKRAILGAAVEVLAGRPGAPLAEVAAAAGVGRTTLHRYFPERADLVDAVSAHVAAQLAGALDRAELGSGDARAALLRACRELFDLGTVLTAVFGPLLATRPEWQDPAFPPAALRAAVDRGRRGGSIDPGLTPGWVQSMLWSVLYAADGAVREGASRHEVLRMALHSLEGAVAPRSGPPGA